jgi:hypothetical protein
MTARAFSLLLLLLTTFSAQAADLAGANVLIPVSGRTFGSHGSRWQTDLVVTNLATRPLSLVLTLYIRSTERVFTTTPIAARGTLVLDDVIWKTFGEDSALGMIRVSSASSGARFTARAYVVNRGNAGGEYGQGIPGVPVDALTTEHVLSGVSAGSAARTNIGVANPWNVPASVILTLLGSKGEQLGKLNRLVPAYEVMQLNEVFGAFGVPPAAEASVHVWSQVGVYAYASIVRNDSGDAVFVPGTGVAPAAEKIAPRCAEPAHLSLAKRDQTPAEGFIVMMRPETTLDYITRVLPEEHDFTLLHVYEALPGFAAVIAPEQLAALRCDSAVEFIEQNVMVPAP